MSKEEIQRATHTGSIRIGDTEIPCAVLKDGTRLLTQTGFQRAIGRAGNVKDNSGSGLPYFLTQKALKPFINNDLQSSSVPIEFYTNKGYKALGYKADLLPKVCDVYLEARRNNVLTKQQIHIAAQCEMVVRGLAQVGITALVDEATGYQEQREKSALQKILDKYLQDEAKKWSKTFPDKFWTKLLRVKGYSRYEGLKLPQFVGHWVNNIVYDRLAPGIKDRLKEVNPVTEKGRREAKHHQYLTDDHGSQALQDHLKDVMLLMDAAESPEHFERMLNRVLPKLSNQLELEEDL